MAEDALSVFPKLAVSALPAFGSSGSLPAGDFLPGRDDFEARFVHAGNHRRRAEIYDGWNRHRAALVRAGIPGSGYQLLNGSVTTSKESPDDLDSVVEVPVARSSDMASMDRDHAVVRLLQGPPTKREFFCHAYPLYSLPLTDELYEAVTLRYLRYWTKWFSRDRLGRRKGRVWATAGGLS